MIVLDANILICSVRVVGILDPYAGLVDFAFAGYCFPRGAPRIVRARGVPVEPPMEALEELAKFIGVVDTMARRIRGQRPEASCNRDEDDWTVLASALALGARIWTEDTDFFGCGVPT